MIPPLFSVIMRTWNRADYLAEAIESVLAQTYPHFELIVCDDGSDDSTPDLMAYYLKKDPRIVYLQKNHTGIADTGNYAIQRARGSLIAQADADDVQMPEKLALTLEGLNKADFVYTGYYHANVKAEPWEYVAPKPLTKASIKACNAICGETIAYHKYVWEKTPYRTELDINDDMGFAIDLFKAEWKYELIDKPTLYYRLLPDGTSYSRKKDVDISTANLIKELDDEQA